ncbi:hypothetical protein ABBQ38_002040 [Trebouxia sp. C0009 RCD-2024]
MRKRMCRISKNVDSQGIVSDCVFSEDREVVHVDSGGYPTQMTDLENFGVGFAKFGLHVGKPLIFRAAISTQMLTLVSQSLRAASIPAAALPPVFSMTHGMCFGLLCYVSLWFQASLQTNLDWKLVQGPNSHRNLSFSETLSYPDPKYPQ